MPRNGISDVDDVVLEAFERALEHLKSAGAIIVEDANVTGLDE